MATPTYTAIASITLSSSASSVTFSSIPQDYRDLVLAAEITHTANANNRIRINNDSSAIYSFVQMFRGGSGAESNSGGGFTHFAMTPNFNPSTNSSEPMTSVCQIIDYSVTDKHKTVLVRTNAVKNTVTDFQSIAAVGWRYADTAAVTSLVFSASTGDLQAGTTINLFGIAS